MLKVDTSKRDAQTLQALRRVDATIEEVICSATHVVGYAYKDGGWERAEIEGPLFVVSRRAGVSRLVVLNRLTPRNLLADADAELELDLIDSYLLYREGLRATERRGRRARLWFHDARRRAACTRRSARSSRACAPPPATARRERKRRSSSRRRPRPGVGGRGAARDASARATAPAPAPTPADKGGGGALLSL